MAGRYVTMHIVQPGVGLVAEAIAHRKAKKSQQEEVEEIGTYTAVIPEDGKLPIKGNVDYEKVTRSVTEASGSEGDPPTYLESEMAQEEKHGLENADNQLHQIATKFEEMQVKPSSPKFIVPKGNALGPAPIKTIVEAFVTEYPPTRTSRPLEASVALPQKRPADQSRGFLYAYAPLLREVGISQPAWLDFLTSFEESIKVRQVYTYT